MPEPRELTYLVPVDVLAEVNTAVAVLEIQGPAVTEALRQLDRATTVGWEAVIMVEVTETSGSSSSARSVSSAAGMRPTGGVRLLAGNGGRVAGVPR
jgi:hypothetical protein